MLDKVGIIGLGLIGGSLAKALKNRCNVKKIVAVNRSIEALVLAKSQGFIDEYDLQITDMFKGCEIIFICTPVDKIVSYAKELIPYLDKSCIVTDVGSTKGHICRQVAALSPSYTFIGGHPMTGSERFRFQAAKEHLFENAYYILTPLKETPKEKTALLSSITKQIGAIPVRLDADEHDGIVAAISHVPHVIASALVNTVHDLDSPAGMMHLLAAGGFKDITRIASASPEMWESICLDNQQPILKVLDHLESIISNAKANITQAGRQPLHDFFDSARVYRDTFRNVTPKSLVERYEITVDVVDRPGSIAIIAVVFCAHNINIKNISIINNREQENGVLFFAFDSEEDRQKSILLLKSLNYEVFEKD